MPMMDWVSMEGIPLGVGVDMVTVSDIRAMDQKLNGAFVEHTFTPRELEEAERSPDRWQYLSERFAAKEAVFKALAHLLPEKCFDFRIVETLNMQDGSPYISHTEPLCQIMKKAGVDSLLLSLCSEGDYAIAFVQAVIQ